MARRRQNKGSGRGLLTFALGVTLIGLALSFIAMPRRETGAPVVPGAPSVTGSGRRATRPSAPVASVRAVGVPRDADTATLASGVLRVRFYDVSQGLAALIELPGGRHILVDAGDSPTRERCGADCGVAHRHLLATLARDLEGAAIDLLYITHQHSDHIGGARDVLAQFIVKAYVDSGRDAAKPEVARTHEAARARSTPVDFVSPSHPLSAELAAKLGGPARVTPIVPAAWPSDCATDPNECSLALRIDFDASSILFTGDAGHGEERTLPTLGKVSLLQVAHHGSETSSTEAFLAGLSPRYAVVSAGHPGVGMNADYCLPRASTLEKLNRALGGGDEGTLLGFAGATSCRKSHGAGWVSVRVSDRLWATERDGDVVLVTHGDGVFERESP